jgi:osmotically-inducible protein OsmY
MVGATLSGALWRAERDHAVAADLASSVKHALLQTHRPELASVQVDVCSGRVHLHGRVSSFHALQCALAAVQRVDGIATICSLIEVRPVR